MNREILLCAALLLAALPATAGEGCTECQAGNKAGNKAAKKTAGDWSARIAKLEAKAQKGDVRAKAELDAAHEACGTMCNKTTAEKMSALEAKAEKGDAEAKKQLETTHWAMVFAGVRTAPLSEQATFYAKACDHGCDVSKRYLHVMMKETGAKDNAALLATVTDWETKASKGCTDCQGKIESLRAKLAPQKKAATVALSARVGELVKIAAKGDEAAKDQLGKIAASIEAKPEQVVVTLQELEAKASNGCGACKAKLAKVEKVLASKGECSDCSDCDDCDKCGEGCGEKGEKKCPAGEKPVAQ